MTTPMPEQRRALRKAADRAVHPVAPQPGDPLVSTPPASAPSPPPPVPGAGAGRRRDRDKRVKLSVKAAGTQSELSLDSVPRGRFEGENPNVFEGEDLNLPPFLRKKK